MKSDQRRELATNELAQMIMNSITRVKPYISHILIAIILVAAGLIAYQKYYKPSLDVSNEATLLLMSAVNAGVGQVPGLTMAEKLDLQLEALDKYIEEHPDSPVLDLAKFSRANRLYDRGLMARADETEASEADTYLAQAGEAFDELKDAEGRVGELARFGADCVVMARGNATEAIDRLTRLAEQMPDTAIAKLANKRIETIRNARPLVMRHVEKAEDAEGGKEGEKGEPSETGKSSPKTEKKQQDGGKEE
ncbi:MAG: hypothetical protein GWP05_07125 [Anaerolineaceae bacterium]|nr:hypothetical protein [Anaerolineaceae bacterium]